MIKDLSKELKAALYQRVNAPIIGTYTIIWCLYNWQGLIPLFFGSKPVEERVSAFQIFMRNIPTDEALDPSFRYEVLLVPALLTFIATVLSPLAQSLVFYYKERVKHYALERKEEFDGQLRLTLPQSDALRRDLKTRHESYEEHISQLNSQHKKQVHNFQMEINDGRKIVESLQESIESYQESAKKLSDENAFLRQDIEKKDSTVNSLRNEISLIKSTLSNTNNEKEDLERNISNLNQAIQLTIELTQDPTYQNTYFRYQKLEHLDIPKDAIRLAEIVMILQFNSIDNEKMKYEYFENIIASLPVDVTENSNIVSSFYRQYKKIQKYYSNKSELLSMVSAELSSENTPPVIGATINQSPKLGEAIKKAPMVGEAIKKAPMVGEAIKKAPPLHPENSKIAKKGN